MSADKIFVGQTSPPTRQIGQCEQRVRLHQNVKFKFMRLFTIFMLRFTEPEGGNCSEVTV